MKTAPAEKPSRRICGQKLDDVGETLSRSATEQVIEAFQQVIVDFNQNLTEQFGDNFKALDASVGKLVAGKTDTVSSSTNWTRGASSRWLRSRARGT